jgi:hypothetical protein
MPGASGSAKPPRASGPPNVCQMYVKWMSSVCRRASGGLWGASGLLGVHPGSGEPPGFGGATKCMSNVCRSDVKCMSQGHCEALRGLWPLGCPPRLWGASWLFWGPQMYVKCVSNPCQVYVKGPLGASGGASGLLGVHPGSEGPPGLRGATKMYVKSMSNGCRVHVKGPLGASWRPLASWVSTQAPGSPLGFWGPPKVCQMYVKLMLSVCQRASGSGWGASGLLGAHPGSGEPPGFLGATNCVSNVRQIGV